MMDAITYSLRSYRSDNDEEYYQTIKSFTDTWLDLTQKSAGELIAGYQSWRKEQGLKVRSFGEHAFELLALGVYLREHGAQAEEFPQAAAILLETLLDVQDELHWAEDVVKTLRGLVNGVSDSGSRRQGLATLDRLLLWLRAQGENTKAERFAEWQAYFNSQSPLVLEQVLDLCRTMAEEFSQTSMGAFGIYTESVEKFLEEVTPHARWRYDVCLVTSSRLDYHLGMLGTEILDRAYRPRFLASEHKMVIVPPCLRALPDGRCQAEQTPMGAKCRGCTPTCRVNQITKVGQQKGLAVYSIPDDQLSKLCVATGQAGSGIGVIGVSCALTNWGAGWEAERLGLPAQGILLDYVGCRKHWAARDIPTDVDIKKIEAMAD
ncbi:MAG: DUF116 domain-containing protein [Anaerolineaceae bacterium]|nr:DUF116 domain-containing protein [Anaerolineaceae bacterium]